jgi:hypothetical protein
MRDRRWRQGSFTRRILRCSGRIPFWFILCLLLTAAFGIGIIILRADAFSVAHSKFMYELSVLLIAAFGFGIIILLYWYLKTDCAC